MQQTKIWLIIIGIVLGLIFLSIWIYKSLSSQPGITITDQGRDHWEHDKLDKFVYNSNPPTSGPHDSDWIRPGIYNVSQDKYKLLHSLEHGYIIIHYTCSLSISNEDNIATPGANLSSQCKNLVETITNFAKNSGLKRIIVQPNSTIDKSIILVAWGKIFKMDSWNEKLANEFANTYHNRGPEQTME